MNTARLSMKRFDQTGEMGLGNTLGYALGVDKFSSTWIASHFGANDHIADYWVQVTRHDTHRVSRFVVLDRWRASGGLFMTGYNTCGWAQRLIDASALSEARFRESVKSGEALGARSIEPFEGGRWRLRWMRADGWTRSNGYGN